MARNMLSSVVRALSENEDNCAICLSVPTDVYYLGCGHAFCTDCLSNWLDHDANQRCPTCQAPYSSPLFYEWLDWGYGFIRIHCVYDVCCWFQWWTILYVFVVAWIWALYVGGGAKLRNDSHTIESMLIVYVSARMISEFLKTGLLSRAVIEFVLCAGTVRLWVRLTRVRLAVVLIIWNIVLVCYKLFAQQVLSPCRVLLLFVANAVHIMIIHDARITFSLPLLLFVALDLRIADFEIFNIAQEWEGPSFVGAFALCTATLVVITATVSMYRKAGIPIQLEPVPGQG